MSDDLLIDGPDAGTTIILAHGAGSGMDTEFMTAFARGLAAFDLRVVRFEFPYMAESRRTGKKRPPDREPKLREKWLDVIAASPADTLIIGGKSMGGRIASLIANEANVAALVCLGYPFHPVGKPDKLRVEHLQSLRTPTLIVQGERDPFGNPTEVASYGLPDQIAIHWLPDGDHSFKPRKASGRTAEENWAEGIQQVREFAESVNG